MRSKALLLLIFSFIYSQQGSYNYWNSLATHVTVEVPLADDNSLVGGRIQVKVSIDDGKNYIDLGEQFFIDEDDIDEKKELSISAQIFESISGFEEGVKAQFIAKLWDKAGNSIIGSVSDSILFIDQTPPELVDLEIKSSNELDKNKAIPEDSITFNIITNESISKPLFTIDGEIYDGAVGIDKSWMLVYPASEASDGLIEYEISYSDIAGNPGESITNSVNQISITKDGTLPKLSQIFVSTSNKFDSSLAIESDTVFLNFKASEALRDITVMLNYNQAKLFKDENLAFSFYHVFTSSDSQGVIPVMIDYRDMAGNIGETIDETSDNSQVILDMNPPDQFQVEKVGLILSDGVNTKAKSIRSKKNKKTSQNQELSVIILSVIGILVISLLIYWVSWFKIFSKSGEAGWKAFIPILNLFIFTKIAKKPIWWLIIYLILPLGYILSSLQLSRLFGKNIIFAIGLILLPIIFYPLLAFGKSNFISK